MSDELPKGWVTPPLSEIAEIRVPTSFIENLEFPLAPLGEQRRIVAKLEMLLGIVDASQQRLAKIPALLKRFRQSVLAGACSGRLTTDWREERTTDDADGDIDLPRSWKSVEFRDLINDGPQNGLYKPASFYGDGALIIRIDAFYDGTIAAWDELKRVRLTVKECRNSSPQDPSDEPAGKLLERIRAQSKAESRRDARK